MKATARWVVIVASAVLALGLRGGTFGENAELLPSEEELKAAGEIAAEVEQEKAIKEQERKILAENHFKQAEVALKEQKYDIAVEELTAAVAGDPENEAYKEALKGARLMQITTLLSQKEFAKAKELCDQFLNDYPGNEPVAGLREQAVAGLESPPAPEPKEEPTAVVVEAEPTVEELLAEADDLIWKKDYKMAMDRLVEAYKLQPYDINIDKKIKRLEEKLTVHARAHYEALREELLTQVYEAWLIRPRRVMRPGAVEVGPEIKEPSPYKQEIYKKLELIIPEVEFEDAKLTEVVDFLSRQADVNIVIHPVVFQGGYSRPSPGLETTPGRPGGVSPSPGGPTMGPTGLPTGPGTTFSPTGETFTTTPGGPGVTGPGFGPSGITEPGATTTTWIPPMTDTGIKLSLKNVPLKDVLKYVLQWQRLKYVVEDYVILIAPIDYVPSESLETEIFRLATTGMGITPRPELTMTGPSSLSGPSEVGSPTTGPSYDFTGEGEPTATETIENFLLRSGVPWPNYGFPGGSNIIYNKRAGTLIVTNTPTNMVLIKELIRLWDQPALQVEIEARFVEILHSRWFENSFQVDMLSPLIFSRSQSGAVPSTVKRSYQFQATPTNATRYFPQLLPMEFPTPDADTILSIRGIMTEPDFQILWRAIDQRDWSDLLSAPRVTTISGQQAQIEVVQELTYPTEYDTETINIGGWGSSTNLVSGEIFMVTPGNWEKRDVGIILNVTPSVSADGKMITLILMPEVTDLVKWINYGNEIYPINQPIFETRNVTTTVHVNDGETIVLGGLITDKTTTYTDKVPLLGSIPFVGRLFRTHAETSAKANLIIFVTARLITSRGTTLLAERAIEEAQGKHLEERLREMKEEGGEIAPGVGTTGIIE